MLVTTMSVPDVQSLIKQSFQMGIKKEYSSVRTIFHMKEGEWKHNHMRMTEFDKERIAEVKSEGGKSVRRISKVGYHKDIYRKTISVTRAISGEASMALTAHGLKQDAMSVGEDIVDKIELDMRNFIGYGDALSYTDNGGRVVDTTTGDGKPVFYNAHTLKHSNKTYSTLLASNPAFSEEALAQCENVFRNDVMDNFGRIQNIKPNTVITTNDATVKNKVTRLLKSISPEAYDATTNSNSSVVNVNKDKYKHLMVDFDVDSLDNRVSSKSKWWALASIGGRIESSFQAYYIRWSSPMIAKPEICEDTWTMSFTARSTYGIGATSARGIVLSKNGS